ncbi:MAG TPA: carboxypeptidase-like regulatory domain-containing protein [Vicinamibacterales bacterium]|nr:carboxypeptidase-like regulatory domain-containing protein [Vicinamibacterales bacterium]
MTTTARLIVLALAASLLPREASAQGVPRRTQRIDPLTASIAGKVTTADTGAPIRGAEVRLSSDGRYSRLGTTNGDGRFELRDLPAGVYRLTVSRTGFITLQFGQRRPFESSTPITLAEGTNTEANVALIRGGVIHGRVLEQSGEPLAGTRVQALRSRVVQGKRRLQSVGAADQTDDTGAFRIYGLPAGDYYVVAAAGLGDQVKRDPPTYYPGTANLAEAQPITILPGAEASADFQIGDVRNARVSGIVVNSAGNPIPAMVNLVSETVSTGPALEGTVAALQVHADAGPDGRFTLENVPPGPYTLTAMLMPGPVGPDVFQAPRTGPPSIADMVRRFPEQAVTPLVVNGSDVAGLTLVTQRAAVLSGSIVADSGVTRPLPRGIRVSPHNVSFGTMMTIGDASNSGFELVGLATPFTIGVQGVPEGWTVKSILLDGRDVIDETVDLHGANAALRIVLSDRPSSVVGSVQSRNESIDYNVVIFPEDSTKWNFESRYIKTTRTDAQGQFRIPDLPAGERYLAAAVDYLEDGEQNDPQFLERLRLRATSFSIGEGEQRSLRLDPISR